MERPQALPALARDIGAVAKDLEGSISRRDWSGTSRHAKAVLGLASRILQRSKVLEELEADAYSSAEVDRALVRQNGQLPQ